MSTAGTPPECDSRCTTLLGTKVDHRPRLEDPFSDEPRNPPGAQEPSSEPIDHLHLKSLRWPPAAAPPASDLRIARWRGTAIDEGRSDLDCQATLDQPAW